MTIKQSTGCTLIQGFPVLLILAQKYNKCLETPFEYHPPSPTHSPEYYEALEALHHTLFGQGYDLSSVGMHGYGTGYHGYGTGLNGYDLGHGYGTGQHDFGTSYHGYGNKYPSFSHVSKPTYTSYNYHKYPVHGYGGVKRVYNYTSMKGYKTYAPGQTYNINNKYKVVVKKNKRRRHKGHKRRSEKLQGFSHRDDRRYSSPIQYGLNLLSAPRRITERLTGVLQFRPENQNSNSQYIYPFRRPGISTENQQQYNNNPDPYGQNYGNYNQGGHQGYNNYPNYGYENNNPVAFPNSSPEGNGVNFVNNNNGQSVNVNDGSAVNFVNNDGQNTESNPPDHGTAVNFVDNSDGQYTESNPSSNGPNAPTYEETNQNNKYGYTQEGKEIEDPNVSFGQPENQNGFNNEPPLATGNNGIPNTPPLGIPSEPPAGIPNQPPAEIPNQPPAGIPSESPAGIPNQPPAGIPNVPPLEIPNTPPDSIPTVPPPGIPDVPPTFAPHPELPELTPVPETEKRNNFNFGSAGLFKENCQTVDQGLGSCISILQCQPYLALLKDSRTNPQATQILRKAHCGFEGNNPKVCCPLPGIPGTPPPAPTTTTTAAPPNPGPQNPTNVDPEDLVSALPEPPVCGNSSATLGRVVGGVKAKLGDFPWMALLGYKRGSSTRWLCGGSLISSKHVLTAAHCINGHEADLYLVRLGELDLESETEGATPVDVLIKYMIKHEDYSPTAFTNDIGILVLDKEMAFTELIRPICIPKDSELRARSFENYNPIIAGWGDTEFRGPSASHLQALQLPVVSNDFCASAYSSYKNQRIDERVLCAGFKAGGKDACQGDSGGPLMQPIWNNQDYTTQFFQIGVVSFGRKCAEAGFPGVYTRVTHFVPWIEQKVIGA